MSIHAEVMQNMKEMAETFAKMGVNLQLPPPSSKTLNTKYTEIDLGKSLTAEIPFDQRFTNPLNMFQGGFLGAVFDEVFGPLTYMSAGRPAVTIEMSTTFIRPFMAKDEFIVVKAELVAKTKMLLVLRAEAKTKDGKLVATSNSQSLILSEGKLTGR